MSEFTSRRGVAATEAQALKMEWFFRSQDVSDQGIDAHLEKAEVLVRKDASPEEVGTGRLLALQIKAGPSYFAKKESPRGWWFSFSAKKAELWLGHALPVIVVLVNLEQDIIYWQHISSRTIQSTGKGYKVEVPRSQVASRDVVFDSPPDVRGVVM